MTKKKTGVKTTAKRKPTLKKQTVKDLQAKKPVKGGMLDRGTGCICSATCDLKVP